MNHIARELHDSLKSMYGEKLREGLVVLTLIGLGRSIMKRTPVPVSAYFQTLGMNEPASEPDDAIKELLENPFECLRRTNEKAAKQLEIQLRNPPRAPFEDEPKCLFRDFGDLIEAIGSEALEKLEGDSPDNLTALVDGMVEASWEAASPTMKNEIQMIIRTLSFLSASIDT